MEDFIRFLKHGYIPLLRQLQPGQKGKWGKMDAQQMIEHMRDIMKVANGRTVMPLLEKNSDRLAAMRAALLTDIPFPQNISAPGLPEEPIPHRAAGIEEAIAKLEPEIDTLFKVYAADPSLTIMHPLLGELDYELQLRYLNKHVFHHLRQFGLAD